MLEQLRELLEALISVFYYNIAVLEHHTDARSRVYPQVAGATVTLISDAVADTFGSWTEIIPINTVDFDYKVIGVSIYGVDAASDYFIQLGYSQVDGTDPVTRQILGEREMRITDVPIAKATELLDFYCRPCPANAELWGRLKTDGGATDEAYITVIVLRHVPLRKFTIEPLKTWPWST